MSAAAPDGEGRAEATEAGARRAGVAAWSSAALLIITLSAVYGTTLHPGVGDGDSAELQTMIPLLGIAHRPGYPIEIVAGWLFQFLPIPGGVAWRVNLLMMLCGIVGAIALHFSVRRMTGSTAAGMSAALTLALSSAYWRQCLIAEVYVFYGMFLLLAVYTTVRFAAGGAARWLYLSALLLGLAVANRPPEVFVLPAFAGAWLALEARPRVRLGQLAVCVLLAVMPWFGSVGYMAWREDSRLLHARDDATLDAILYPDAKRPEARPVEARLGDAAAYSLGLLWARERAAGPAGQLAWDLDKYFWTASGLDVVAPRFTGSDAVAQQKRSELRHGVNIGLLGLLLAVGGVCCWRRFRPWVVLGGLMWVGNLGFYLWHHPADNLDFVVPGLAGLAILLGLSVAALDGRGAGVAGGGRARQQMLCGVAWLVAVLPPVFLLLANYGALDRSTPAEAAQQANARRLAAAALPQGGTIIAQYDFATVLRYMYHVEDNRPDVQIINLYATHSDEDCLRILSRMASRGGSVFLPAGELGPEEQRQLALRTPAALREVGLLQAAP
ncbi:MAG: hypothetical protein CHACPFDD_01233 [Phycisphaerae bacterium]|nr:hypothetical protein [Phycisphaerae bacterium]